MPAKLHEVSVQLSPEQGRKLKKGLAIRLAANRLTGPHMIMVSKILLNRIMKRRTKGKGLQIKLCPRGIEGSGFFSSIGNAIKKAANAVGHVIKDGAVAVYKHREEILKGIKTAIEVAKTIKTLKGGALLQEEIDEITGEGFMSSFVDVLKKAGKHLVDNKGQLLKGIKGALAISKVIKELRNAGMSQRQVDILKGGGFFKDFAKGFAKGFPKGIKLGLDGLKLVAALKGGKMLAPRNAAAARRRKAFCKKNPKICEAAGVDGEGFKSFIKGVVKVAPAVIKAAPGVIKVVKDIKKLSGGQAQAQQLYDGLCKCGMPSAQIEEVMCGAGFGSFFKGLVKGIVKAVPHIIKAIPEVVKVVKQVKELQGQGLQGGRVPGQRAMTARERRGRADMAAQSLSNLMSKQTLSVNVAPLGGEGLHPSGGGLFPPGHFLLR